MPQALKGRLLASLELFPATNQELSCCSCCSGLPSVEFAVHCTVAGTLHLHARPCANIISLTKGLTPCAPPEALPPFWHPLCTPQAAGVIFPKAQLGRKGPALPGWPHVPFLPLPFLFLMQVSGNRIQGESRHLFLKFLTGPSSLPQSLSPMGPLGPGGKGRPQRGRPPPPSGVFFGLPHLVLPVSQREAIEYSS